MIKAFNKLESRRKRHQRIRTHISGTPEKPRLTVFKSNTNIYCQIIDDTVGKTIVSCSTLDKDVKDGLSSLKNKEAAKKVGETIAKRAMEKGIKEIVFDRSGYLYHGKIKELAEGAREAGLEF